MVLSIKDPEADRLARELAAVTGEPITTVVRDALAIRLAAVRARAATTAGEDLWGIIERGRRRRVLDSRSAEEILGYDEHGLPA